MKYLTIALAAAAVTTSAQAGQSPEEVAVARGRALSDWTSADGMANLSKSASPEFKATLEKTGTPAAIAATIKEQIGPETKVLDEFAITVNGVTTYSRLAAYEKVPVALTTMVWDATGAVQGAGIVPSSPPLPAVDPATETAIRLPFAKSRQGDWLTYWGGRNAARNYHVIAPDQIYAFDFVVTRGGRTHDGPVQEPASYFCWGEPVLAPADGVVTEVVDGIADNVPVGAMNAQQPAGNHVVIRHGGEVHSLAGHLQNGSTAVKLGDAVKAGQKIGLCGNSGNTSEPHVHFHLQTTAGFGKGGKGLPAFFQDTLVDGRPAVRGEPVRGQIVAPAK